MAEALQKRGLAVAVLGIGNASELAPALRELAAHADPWHVRPVPVILGEDAAAAMAMRATDAVAGVVGLNGSYDGVSPPANAPPMLLLSSHGDSPHAAESTRAFARIAEAAGVKVRAYHFSSRTAASLANVSGERNDVANLVVAFAEDPRAPAAWSAEEADTWSALTDRWGATAPLSSEGFWKDERLVVRRPQDAQFRAELRRVYGEMANELEPWPLETYAAIDLGTWLGAHPELGSGDFVRITNARGEQLVLTRKQIDEKKPSLVIGIDDERNLFRMFVTYNVLRAYSWKQETTARPLLVRNVGAFLYEPGGSIHAVTGADHALLPTSFEVLAADPLAKARPLSRVLTNEQGCLQCHALHGEGARAHHVRADDGKLAEGFGLALEEYPPEVLERFLFHQKDVAKTFGVGPLEVPEPAARVLLTEAMH